MVYYSKTIYKLLGYRKSTTKNSKYDAILINKTNQKKAIVPFGKLPYENYHDLTKLGLYPHLIHGDASRRKNYKSRHKKDLKQGYYSPGYFSYHILW